MGDPYIERKTTPSKLDSAPSIQRKTTPSKLDAAPSIQRGATGSRGTPLKGSGDKVRGAPTQRQAAQQAAKDLGIDTKGLSTRELKEAVSEKKAAQEVLAAFLTKVIEGLPKNSAPAAAGTPSTAVTTKSEDPPSGLGSAGGKHGKTSSPTDVGDNGIPENFYCYYDGKFGYIPLITRGFVEIPTT